MIFLLGLGLLVAYVPLEVQFGEIGMVHELPAGSVHLPDHGDLLVCRLRVVESLQSFVQQFVLLLNGNSFIGIVAVFHVCRLGCTVCSLVKDCILVRSVTCSEKREEDQPISFLSSFKWRGMAVKGSSLASYSSTRYPRYFAFLRIPIRRLMSAGTLLPESSRSSTLSCTVAA